MKIIGIGFILLCATVGAQTQASHPSATTSGNCSPALNGNNNQVSITCTGISAQKANDLIKVMNQILARQLDLKQVNDQLAQLHSDVENLSGALNPLDAASPEQVDLWQKAEQTISDCNAFGSQWNQLN
jgi:ABC-type transporter Mla subunit MlaD